MNLIYIVPALRIVLGLLLIITGFLKVPNLRAFSVIVASYGVLPRSLIKPLAYAQPFIEIIIGSWVLSGEYLYQGALAGLGLMAVATLFVLSALIRKKKMDNCGCYGVAVKVPLSWRKFGENIVWMFLFALLAFAAGGF